MRNLHSTAPGRYHVPFPFACGTMPDDDVIHIEIGEAEAGSRIDRFLGKRFHPTYSRSYLTGLIAAGKIRVGGETVRPAYRLGVGDRIAADLAPQTEGSPEPEEIELDVAYEDDFILLVRKPAGMIVHPGPNKTHGTLVNALMHRNPDIARVGVLFRPGIVHRLDGYTSGIMVVAKTNPARAALVEQFKTKKVRKEYLAIVVGTMPFDSDYIDLPIGTDRKHRERMAIDREGKPSSTYYEVKERFDGATLTQAQPFTGRTHQIRVHLAHIGFPVIADPIYGKRYGQAFYNARKAKKDKGLPYPTMKRHALHAHRLSLDHPVTGERMTFEAPLPHDMQRLLDHYREHAPLPA